MANVIDFDKQVAIISALAEGSSIRAVERITGVHRDTIMRLGVRVGKGCQALLDHKMRGLSYEHLQYRGVDLIGHPTATRLYAWAHDTDDPKKPRRHVTVLHVAPIESPIAAVRASIVRDYRLGEAQ